MFSQSSSRNRACPNWLVVLVAAPLVWVSLSGQTPAVPTSKSEIKAVSIPGRVLADIDSQARGAGLGPKYKTFIFGWEQNEGPVLPIKIGYAYFDRHSLPASFFDYTKRYELVAVRETSCDETVGSLSLIKNVDSSGRALPPTDALRLLDGVPKGLFKPQTSLPCYIVGEGRFKSLPSDK